MTTTAEGIETEQQRELLRALGCSEMQGYLFSPPKPAAEIRPLFGPARTQAKPLRLGRGRKRKPVAGAASAG
jgi:EAL domain-containing protein (putative c-di-GMP-specific phosphodiesterase class I)